MDMSNDQAEALAASGYEPPDVAGSSDRRAHARGQHPSFVAWFAEHIRLAGTVATVSVGIGAVIASFGFKVYGPGARVDQIAQQMASQDSVLAHHERRIDRLEQRDDFTSYLLCVVLRRSDPAAVPNECGPIISARRVP